MNATFGEHLFRLQKKRILPLIILPVIIAAYLLLVLSLHPTNIFGLSQDDTLYFSSAKALAEGKGYILPSVPGSPAATKYPILYPWLLSWVWRISPSFPQNLSLAIGMTLSFGVAEILLMYLFLRLLLQVPRIESLLVTAFCTLHPAMILYSTSLMTDIPFAAFCTAALICAGLALKADSDRRYLLLAALFADLIVLLRLAGIAIVAGIILALLLRRRWKAVTTFALSVLPAFGYFAYHTWFRAAANPPVPFSAELSGWRQTWFYYTSYTAFRQLDSPNLPATMTLLLNQFLYFLSSIAGYFLTPLTDASIAVWFVCCLAIVALLAVGLAKQFRDFSPPVEVVAFLGYSALLFGWDYSEWTRFLLPFFPLLAVLVSREIFACDKALAASTDPLSRGLLAILRVGVTALALGTAWNYIGPARTWLPAMSFERLAQRPGKFEAYEWIRLHTTRRDRIIAAEDGSAYFYTNRQFMNFTVLMPYDVYDPDGLQRDLRHMPDVAIALGARYWLITDQDSQTQLRMFRQPLQERLSGWEKALPLVFRSQGGQVRIYDTSCFASPRFEACPEAVRALLAAPGDVQNGSHWSLPGYPVGDGSRAGKLEKPFQMELVHLTVTK